MGKALPISKEAFERAQTKADRDITPFAVAVRYQRRSHRIRITLNTGLEVAFPAAAAYGLANATDRQLARVVVEGGGTTIGFPLLDQYFTVSRLLEGFLGPLDWSRRERRAAASRNNGRLGGRPRKGIAKRVIEATEEPIPEAMVA